MPDPTGKGDYIYARRCTYPYEPKGIYDIGEDVVHGVGGCVGAMERFPIGGPLTCFLGGEGAYTFGYDPFRDLAGPPRRVG
jgi:hypothetical protein